MVKSTNNPIQNMYNMNITDLISKKEFFTKGSESFIFKGQYFAKDVIIKERRPKSYRNRHLDHQLRLQRLRIESKMIKTALNNNIVVPSLISVDLKSFSLILEEIKGYNLGTLLTDPINSLDPIKKKIYFQQFGQIVAKLHNIEIIHGDLTPLNILIANEQQIYIIDFGLAFYSNEIKDKSMDLFILYGALKIYLDFEILFENFLLGYKISTDYTSVIENFNKLTRKGRYKE